MCPALLYKSLFLGIVVLGGTAYLCSRKIDNEQCGMHVSPVGLRAQVLLLLFADTDTQNSSKI